MAYVQPNNCFARSIAKHSATSTNSPIPYAHVTTTTTHKTLRGPRGGMILSSEEFATEHKLNKAVFPGIQGGPLMHVIFIASNICFI